MGQEGFGGRRMVRRKLDEQNEEKLQCGGKNGDEGGLDRGTFRRRKKEKRQLSRTYGCVEPE